MSTEQPLVSVVIPTYNRADVLGRALDSALSQTVEAVEVVVVDDGSTDRTRTVVESSEDSRVRYVAHEQNCGVSAARNTGIDAACGEYVAFLDSDDEWLPRKLERQLSAIDDRGDDWIGAYCETVTADASAFDRIVSSLSDRLFRRRGSREGGTELAYSLLSMQVFMGPGSTLVVERSVLQRIGGFDEGLSIYEDWDLVLRVLAEGKLAYVDEPLAVVHRSGDAPGYAYAANDRRYLDRNEELVEQLRQRGVDVERIHRLGVAGHFLTEGSFREAATYLDSRVLTRPADLARVALWTVLGLRARVAR